MNVPAEHRAKSQCDGKLRYRMEWTALSAAQRCADQWGHEVFVYECDLCAWWHVSSKMLPPDAGYPIPSAVAFPKAVTA